jgi:pimeloyl-ACP methyl ester carboxylesterase
MTMQTKTFPALTPHGFYRISYTEWGDPTNDRVLLCVHGMTRNGRDFDFLAAALANDYRVVCPTMLGRGDSDWLPVKEDYDYPHYCAHIAALIARLGVEQVDWVGTSMGGLIGMVLASMPNSPLRRLVMNDVGPFISTAAIERIATYVGANPRFQTLAEAERYIREINSTLGFLTDAQWQHVVRHYTRRTEHGEIALAYDPNIDWILKKVPLQPVDLWFLWEAVQCPVLLLRGKESDVLTAEGAREMLRRKPGTRLVELDGIGHAPTLMSEAQIGLVRDWLLSAD